MAAVDVPRAVKDKEEDSFFKKAKVLDCMLPIVFKYLNIIAFATRFFNVLFKPSARLQLGMAPSQNKRPRQFNCSWALKFTLSLLQYPQESRDIPAERLQNPIQDWLPESLYRRDTRCESVFPVPCSSATRFASPKPRIRQHGNEAAAAKRARRAPSVSGRLASRRLRVAG